MYNIYSIYIDMNEFTNKKNNDYIRKLAKINPSLKIITSFLDTNIFLDK